MGATSFGGGPGFGAPPPPAFGGGPPMGGPPLGATSIGSAFGGSAPSAGPPPPSPGPPPPSAGRAPSGSAPGIIDAAEIQRMQRRIDQLSTELRMQRGGGQQAMKMEELEDKITRLEKDNQELERRYKELEKMAAAAGADYTVGGNVVKLNRAEEVVVGLNDIVSELRINLLAADGEIEQYANLLPPASYELVRESIKMSRAAMESARDYMRMLREIR
jgi:hypothetical protein